MTIVHHGNCEHLLPNCSVRDIVYYDIFKRERICLRICNEWFKLNYIQFIKENSKYLETPTESSLYYYSEFVEKLICENLSHHNFDYFIGNITGFKENNEYNKKNPFKSIIKIEMCRRPFLSYRIVLIDLIEYFINLRNEHKYDYVIEKAIENSLKDIKLYCPVYSTLHPEVIRVINKIIRVNNYGDDGETLRILFNDLFITILNTKKYGISIKEGCK